MSTHSDEKVPHPLVELFLLFFKIGLVTFGGGLAMLPILEEELVTKRGWATKERLLDYFAIGQTTPGIIAVNVATFIGYTRAGVLGGCIATAGVVFPSLIIITLIALVFSNFNSIVWVKKALTGINIAVAALLSKIVWSFRKTIFSSILAVFLFVCAFVLIVVFKTNTVFVIIGAAAAGCICYSIKMGKTKK